MLIGGFLPLSLSDFPGRVAAVVYTSGCNLRCPWCHNPGLVKCSALTSCEGLGEGAEAILAKLSKRRRLLEGVVVTGGEPCIWPQLPRFLRRLKALGFFVKLDTNGTRPEILEKILDEGLVDFVAMDLKAPLNDYVRVAGVPVSPKLLERSIDLLVQSGVEHELRTTIVPGFHNEALLDTMGEIVPDGTPWRLQPLIEDGELLDASWVERQVKSESKDQASESIEELANCLTGSGLMCNARVVAGEMAVRVS